MNHYDITANDTLVPFETLKEEWSRYELEDGSIIKTKFILINIIKTPVKDDSGRNLVSFESNNILSVFSPKEIRGEKDKNYPVEELEKYIKDENLKFRMIEEGGWNEYKTEKQIIKIINKVKRIDKTSKFDLKGMPSYIVRSETEILVSEAGIDKQ